MNQGPTIAPRSVTVQIPNELANYLLQETEVCGHYLVKRTKGNSSHRLAKFYGFYLLLKAEAPGSGWILNYTKQIPELSRNFGISQRTFFSYLSQLEKLKIAFREGDKIRLVGWDQLGRLLDINTRQRTKIQFTYDGKQKIHWWFAALEIKSNQELQAFTVWKKAHKNSNTASVIRDALIKRGFDLKQENNPVYYSGRLLMLMIEDFRFGTEVHDILISIRSDVNRSCKKIAKSWSMSMPLLCYWKKQMIDQQIISQATIEIMSEWEWDRRDCGKNKFCRVVWDDKEKQRVWRLCKQISVIIPGESWEKWKEKYEKNMAA